MRWLLPVIGCAACGAPTPSVPGPEPAAVSTAPHSSPAASSTPAPEPRPIFAFHSGRWTNVHHWLHYAATGRRPPPEAAPVPPSAPAWAAAVRYYRDAFGAKGGFGLVFDEGLIDMHRGLSTLGPQQITSTILTPEHAQHLAAANDVVDWSREDARNQRWITALEPRVTEHGEGLVAELSAIYATSWPPRPIRVDVSCFAGPVGAYTVGGPAHIIISSCDPDYGGESALEMIFHEASHTLSDEVEAKIAAAAKRRGKKAPRNLWHAVIFYTAGELARRRLGPDYVPYAQRRKLWGGPMGPRAPLETEWQPYLDGERSLDAAIEALVGKAAAE